MDSASKVIGRQVPHDNLLAIPYTLLQNPRHFPHDPIRIPTQWAQGANCGIKRDFIWKLQFSIQKTGHSRAPECDFASQIKTGDQWLRNRTSVLFSRI